ncbi:MAG TPA: hypothetical protein VFO39_02215 [Candidatus Sulfotelmatobacter sp.]|nr:hypothetical protein [Candidatus Sulfotelmatobacter sp.]
METGLYDHDPTLWKQVFHDALMESNPRVYEAKLESARKAMMDRLVRLSYSDNADGMELRMLNDALHALSILQGLAVHLQ